jgi:hypothetical protein
LISVSGAGAERKPGSLCGAFISLHSGPTRNRWAQ